MTQTLIIIGGGHAASQLISSLQSGGFQGNIQLIGQEPYVPYQRPPLSKQFLAGTMEIDKVYLKPPEFYAEAGVELFLNTTVTTIDRDAQTVTLDNGRILSYDKLALTTGSRVRELPVPGVDLKGVFYLRNIDHIRAIQPYMQAGAKLVIVGGGYIGLEAASVALKQGIDVSVLEMEPRILNRVVAPEVSDFFTRLHSEEGVHIYTQATVSAFQGNEQVNTVLCQDGQRFPADFVIIGIGIVPNSELAAAAELETDNGIVVDEYCRTRDPNIVAAGDCTNHPNSLLNRRLRLESVHNALSQGRTAAATLCGKLTPYAEVPRFWSDQYDLRLQILGLSQDYDQLVLRGDPAGRSFLACYLRAGQIIAVDAVNNPKEFMLARKLILDQISVDPSHLADINIPLKSLA